MLDALRTYTLGYQGITIDQYVSILLAHNVSAVLDVRETPWSYKRGFSKKILAETLQANGIGYVHLKAAGNPSKNRKQGLPPEEVIELYREHLEMNPACLDQVFDFIQASVEEGPVCLLCFEERPHECHRKIILDKLSEQHGELLVVHLHAQSPSLEEERVQFGIPETDDRKGTRKHMEVAEDEARLVFSQVE